MRASEAFIRILIQLAGVAVLCAAFIMFSGSQDAALILILPFFLGIPGVVVIPLIFVPVEAFAIRRNKRWVALLLHPALGAAIPWALYPFAGNRDNFFNGIEMVMYLGLGWGLLWSATWVCYVAYGGGKPPPSRRTDAAQAPQIHPAS